MDSMPTKPIGRSPRRGRLARPAVLLGVLACAGPLAGCAYTETMNERNAEGVRLQQDLQFEQERARKLAR